MITRLDFTFYAFMYICIVVVAYLTGVIVGMNQKWVQE